MFSRTMLKLSRQNMPFLFVSAHDGEANSRQFVVGNQRLQFMSKKTPSPLSGLFAPILEGTEVLSPVDRRALNPGDTRSLDMLLNLF